MKTYQENLNGITDQLNAGVIDATTAADLKKQAAQQEFGSKSFDINEFSDLLGKLEGSKVRQARAGETEKRRDIMTQGLAGMMSNF